MDESARDLARLYRADDAFWRAVIAAVIVAFIVGGCGFVGIQHSKGDYCVRHAEGTGTVMADWRWWPPGIKCTYDEPPATPARPSP